MTYQMDEFGLYIKEAKKKIADLEVNIRRLENEAILESCRQGLIWTNRIDGRITAWIVEADVRKREVTIETSRIFGGTVSFSAFFELYKCGNFEL